MIEIKIQTGNGLVVYNMLHVYKQLKAGRYNFTNHLYMHLGYLEACVQNFTSIREDVKALDGCETGYEVLVKQIPYKTLFGKTKYRKEDKKDILLRYAEEFFINNNIEY